MKSVAKAMLALTLLIGLAASWMPAASNDAGPSQSGPLTIGEFAVAVAKAMDNAPETRATVSPEDALAMLKGSGWSFSGSSDTVMTQAEFATFMRQAGLKVQVSSPEKPVSSEQAKAAIAGFGSYLASKAAATLVAAPTSRPDQQGPRPESFAECAALPRTPDCRQCCTDLGLSSQSCGRACGQAHASQQTSASEPTP